MSENIELFNQDCVEVMKGMDENSIDAIVTDPPYGLSFMGKKWDIQVPTGEIWEQAFRVAKPGARLLSFGGTRTFHRMACAIEDAGWEIVDTIMWVYGQGFPKSMDISKAIDKKLGAQRKYRNGQGEHVGVVKFGLKNVCPKCGKPYFSSNPCVCPREDKIAITDEAKKWNGWGTCLKPAYEPIIVAKKPISEKTIADNVLKWGVGGINIDGCRVQTNEIVTIHSPAKKTLLDSGHKDLGTWKSAEGRFPANLVHDGSEEVLACFPESNGSGPARVLHRSAKPEQEGWGMNKSAADETPLRDAGTGSAARFFYCAKASKSEKGEGNNHPTVKPVSLMKWLVTMVVPDGGVVLDPFMGSGTTGVAAVELGKRFIGCELESEYFNLAKQRIDATIHQNKSK